MRRERGDERRLTSRLEFNGRNSNEHGGNCLRKMISLLLLILALSVSVAAAQKEQSGPTLAKAEAIKLHSYLPAWRLAAAKRLEDAAWAEAAKTNEMPLQCPLCECLIINHQWLCFYVGQIWMDCELHIAKPCKMFEVI